MTKTGAAACATAVCVAACYSGLVVRSYAFKTRKLSEPVRMALITDLHGCYYGGGQSRLLAKIDRHKPDAIVMAGDIIDERMPLRGVIDLLKGIRGKYPCYYAAGNHESRTGKMDKVKTLFSAYGVNVLDGVCKNLTVKSQTIDVCGVDDPESGAGRFRGQLKQAFLSKNDSRYTVLLSHRPEKIRLYAGCGYDLVLCGHAHGGQWRLPYLLNGLYAPNQGLFPKYAGGRYRSGATDMVVSRGLARESTPFIPRIFNPPELVIIDIIPEKPGEGPLT